MSNEIPGPHDTDVFLESIKNSTGPIVFIIEDDPSMLRLMAMFTEIGFAEIGVQGSERFAFMDPAQSIKVSKTVNNGHNAVNIVDLPADHESLKNLVKDVEVVLSSPGHEDREIYFLVDIGLTGFEPDLRMALLGSDNEDQDYTGLHLVNAFTEDIKTRMKVMFLTEFAGYSSVNQAIRASWGSNVPICTKSEMAQKISDWIASVNQPEIA